jgi:DNA modification methylase
MSFPLESTQLIKAVVPKRFRYADKEVERLTHYLFRYPAKFHPPIVRALIEEYTAPGERILDPFCGSGSMLVEARVLGRHSVGSDVDPIAVFASKVKTHRYHPKHLKEACGKLRLRLTAHERSEREYKLRQFTDIASWRFSETVIKERLYIPEIPNIFHWFRRYVVVDLARIHREICRLDAPNSHREFLFLCFASIIRAVSNADPVPVSGLEVTSHMRRKDEEGRIINPFHWFCRTMDKNLAAVAEFGERTNQQSQVSVFQANASVISRKLRSEVDVVITSPPYHNAVDYYRRHKLEMFWLGFTKTQAERLSILPHYIGRPGVASCPSLMLLDAKRAQLSLAWEKKIRRGSPRRANAFRQYLSSMLKVIDELARILTSQKYAIFVVGRSAWNGHELPTAELLIELANAKFALVESFWYPVINRYMSYSRHNGANINREYILVFKRR